MNENEPPDRLAQIENAVLRLPAQKAPPELRARVLPRVEMLLARKRKAARPLGIRLLPYAAVLALGLAAGGLYLGTRNDAPRQQQLRAGSDQSEKEMRQRIELLRDPEAHVRAAAAEQLGATGATEAIPALTKALEDSSPEVRAAAAQALERIRQGSP